MRQLLVAKTFWTHCEYSLGSLNFLLSRNQTNPKWGRKVILQLGRIWFRILLRQLENFSDFGKVLSRFAFRKMIVPLPKSQTRHPARAQASLHLVYMFLDATNFYKILSLRPIVIAKSGRGCRVPSIEENAGKISHLSKELPNTEKHKFTKKNSYPWPRSRGICI